MVCSPGQLAWVQQWRLGRTIEPPACFEPGGRFLSAFSRQHVQQLLHRALARSVLVHVPWNHHLLLELGGHLDVSSRG